jgi:hypothetical protein
MVNSNLHSDKKQKKMIEAQRRVTIIMIVYISKYNN